jgi:hypothetical protein
MLLTNGVDLPRRKLLLAERSARADLVSGAFGCHLERTEEDEGSIFVLKQANTVSGRG